MPGPITVTEFNASWSATTKKGTFTINPDSDSMNISMNQVEEFNAMYQVLNEVEEANVKVTYDPVSKVVKKEFQTPPPAH